MNNIMLVSLINLISLEVNVLIEICWEAELEEQGLGLYDPNYMLEDSREVPAGLLLNL